MFIMPRGPAPKPSGGHGCGLMMRSVDGRIGSLWSSMAPCDRWWLGMGGVKSFVVCSLVCDGSLQLLALVGVLSSLAMDNNYCCALVLDPHGCRGTDG